MLNDRPYFSIGEVLGLLLEEFPDVTISKIRFLEGQGLIDPERTSSGYRKFYDRDLNRLRFILREQKDHYLPLKVIKERLEGTEGTPVAPPRPVPVGASWALLGNAEPPEPAEAEPAWEAEQELTADSTSAFMRIVHDPGDDRADRQTTGVDQTGTGAAPPPRSVPIPPRAEPAVAGAAPGRAASAAAPLIEAGEINVELSAPDLCRQAGITEQLLAQMREYGLLEPRTVGGESVFGLDALRTATSAGRLAGHGLEARHLRTWKVSAEREAALFEQMIQPMIRQRNPASRRQAAELAAELSNAGADLRAALMRQALGSYLDE